MRVINQMIFDLLENGPITFFKLLLQLVIREYYKFWEKQHCLEQKAIRWCRLAARSWNIKLWSHSINLVNYESNLSIKAIEVWKQSRYESNRSMSSLRNFDFKTYTPRQNKTVAWKMRDHASKSVLHRDTCSNESFVSLSF